MTKLKSLKNYLKSHVGRSVGELTAEIEKERSQLSKETLEFLRGSSKKTHLFKQQRRKIALLKTLISQKQYLPGGQVNKE